MPSDWLSCAWVPPVRLLKPHWNQKWNKSKSCWDKTKIVRIKEIQNFFEPKHILPYATKPSLELHLSQTFIDQAWFWGVCRLAAVWAVSSHLGCSVQSSVVQESLTKLLVCKTLRWHFYEFCYWSWKAKNSSVSRSAQHQMVPLLCEKFWHFSIFSNIFWFQNELK